jgi:arginyl-tRNA synthetase
MAAAGLELVQKYLKEGIFEESDGAIIFPAKKHGMNNNRVFVNSLGIPTYEGKDMALAPAKFKDFPYDKSYIITADEQTNHFQVVFKALSLVNPELAKKTQHIPHGVVKLPGGKISSRTGDVITAEWLIDEAKSRILTAYSEIDEETAEKVGLAAIKYAFLKSGIGSNITFNFDESISLNGASGPYLQYAYVRTQSILEENAKAHGGEKSDGEHELRPAEKELIRHLVHFPEIVTDAQEKLAPNLVAEYLFQTAQKFNSFYENCNMLKATPADRKPWLELTSATGQVIKSGLNLLGIETVKKM